MPTRQDIPVYTALRDLLDGASPAYRDLELWELVEKSKYGDQVAAELVTLAMAHLYSPNQTVARTNEKFRDLLFDVFAEIGNDVKTWPTDQKKPRMSKAYLCRRALDEINDPDPDTDVGRLIVRALAEGYLPAQMPSAETLADEDHWFGKMSWRAMIGEE